MAKINDRGILLVNQYGALIAKRCWKNRTLYCTDDCAMFEIEGLNKKVILHCAHTQASYSLDDINVKDVGFIRQ